MTLKHQYDKKDDIPEQYRELYSEKNGKWEVTGITGIKTEADLTRVQNALEKERNDHKETKAQLKTWTELGELDTVQKSLDRMPELEAAAKGKLDEAAIEDLVNKRVDGVIKSRTAPLERQLKTLSTERDTLKLQAEELTGRERRRTVHDAIRQAAEVEKLLPAAVEDALVLGERVFEIGDDGGVVTRDGVGVTPGLKPKDWLGEIRDRRPHWWPASTGGGAAGSGARGGMPTGADNPFSHEGWNLTKQGQYIREHGAEKATAAAKAAGTSIGGSRPGPKQQPAKT